MMWRRVVWLLVAACGGGSPPSVAPTGPTTPVPDAVPRSAISVEDCRALTAAPALGVAVVVSSAPDCSGIGNARSVLEVKELARGDGMRTIVTSRPLHGSDDGVRYREGETVVVAVEPKEEPARTVSCVPLPASDGTVRHAVGVDDVDAGRRLLASLVDGTACPAP